MTVWKIISESSAQKDDIFIDERINKKNLHVCEEDHAVSECDCECECESECERRRRRRSENERKSERDVVLLKMY